MKKLILIMTLIAISFSSCLKDSATTVNFAKAGNFVNFPLSGLANFSSDAVTSDTAVIKFATDYATVNPNGALTATLAVDFTLMDKYNAANPGITFIQMPTSAYTLSSTTVNIPAGAQYAFTTLTVYKNTLDPAKSYMLPIKIAGTGGVPISANQSVHYYHVIGNDFAGGYNQIFRRWNADDSTSVGLSGASFGPSPVTFFPVSPSEFTVKSGYAGSLISYDVAFTKNSDGTYSNFTVQMLPSDVSVTLPANGLSMIQNAKFLFPPNPTTHYTFVQAVQFFRFQWIAHSSADRYLVDIYYK